MKELQHEVNTFFHERPLLNNFESDLTPGAKLLSKRSSDFLKSLDWEGEGPQEKIDRAINMLSAVLIQTLVMGNALGADMDQEARLVLDEMREADPTVPIKRDNIIYINFRPGPNAA